MTTRKPHRRIPLADQRRRRRELDDIRMQRPLTASERAEDDDLAQRAFQRDYQAAYRRARADLQREFPTQRTSLIDQPVRF